MRAILGRERPIEAGERIKQPALADTLQAIADKGNDGFYRGDVARKIADAHKRKGGLVTEADLARYKAIVRKPLSVDYRGYTVLTMPPPSMGGIALTSILLAELAVPGKPPEAGSAESLHRFIESSKRAYADRRAVGADPDMVDKKKVGPMLARLLDPRYHAERKPPIDPERATPSTEVVPIYSSAAPAESSDTTHFSVVDAEGNAVSCTTTLSAAFGARVAVPDTGVILSNAMGGFSPFGVNALAPHKRMASSMTPTIIVAGNRLVAVLGSPGGDTIPGIVAQVALNLIDHRMTIDQAIDAGRVHHQHIPDQVRIELGRPPVSKVLKRLEAMGHSLKPSRIALGDVNGIVFDASTHNAWGFADDRKDGFAYGPPPVAGPGQSGRGGRSRR
jgi:gamma-glutamyltranspeptidase/glutathione hydrolase